MGDYTDKQILEFMTHYGNMKYAEGLKNGYQKGQEGKKIPIDLNTLSTLTNTTYETLVPESLRKRMSQGDKVAEKIAGVLLEASKK